MLNWAVRYFPILRALRPHLSDTDRLLEIGSGTVGLGMFCPASFVGCEIKFAGEPKRPMLPVTASATNLPFEDKSFDGVVASDVLEHIPLDLRTEVIREALRVTRKVAIFGFPSGCKAAEYDLRLAAVYDRCSEPRPEWLTEHLRFQPFPTIDMFKSLGPEWMLSGFGNENVAFHNWVMEREMHRFTVLLFDALLTEIPHLVEAALQLADREPFYRQIVVVKRAC